MIIANEAGEVLWSGPNRTLIGADLGRARLGGANLRGIDLRFADLSHAELTGADLSLSRLDGANLRCAKMGGVRLMRASAVEAVFVGADLMGAIFHGADLTGADFRSCDLRAVEGIDTAITRRAKIDSTAPPEAQPPEPELTVLAPVSGLDFEQVAPPDEFEQFVAGLNFNAQREVAEVFADRGLKLPKSIEGLIPMRAKGRR